MAVRGHVAAGAHHSRMYTRQGGGRSAFNNSYCHVMADLQCRLKQTFLQGLTDVPHDGQMTSLPQSMLGATAQV